MNNIYIFTHSFPYGLNAETFLEDEIKVAASMGVDVTLIPLYSHIQKRELPKNIKVYCELSNISLIKKIAVFLKMCCSGWFWNLFFQKDPPHLITYRRQAFKYLYGSFLIEYFLKTHKNLFEKESIFYSYWCNHTPLGLVWARLHDQYYKDCRIYSRAHGFDVYEQQVGIYIPYRNFMLENIDKVFVVSKKGVDFMQKKYITSAHKIIVSKLGVFHNISPKCINNDWTISFVSCSSVIPIKRVDLIFLSIVEYCQKYRYQNIKWTHIGGGDEFERLNLLIKNTSCSNLYVELIGGISRVEVIEIYLKSHFDIFINMSLSEGIPVSIMEAISRGIPIIATDVGGNNEIVNQETGILLSIDFNIDEFINSVNCINKNKINYKKSTYQYYINEYNAQMNYQNFYRQLLS